MGGLGLRSPCCSQVTLSRLPCRGWGVGSGMGCAAPGCVCTLQTLAAQQIEKPGGTPVPWETSGLSPASSKLHLDPAVQDWTLNGEPSPSPSPCPWMTVPEKQQGGIPYHAGLSPFAERRIAVHMPGLRTLPRSWARNLPPGLKLGTARAAPSSATMSCCSRKSPPALWTTGIQTALRNLLKATAGGREQRFHFDNLDSPFTGEDATHRRCGVCFEEEPVGREASQRPALWGWAARDMSPQKHVPLCTGGQPCTGSTSRLLGASHSLERGDCLCVHV